MKKIKVRVSTVVDNMLGTDYYSHYVTFPKKQTYSYTIKASMEGFMHTQQLWEEAGYEVEFEIGYPK